MRNLLSVIEDIRDRALFPLLLWTRIRIGEAFGLRLNNPIFKAGRFTCKRGRRTE